MWSQNMPDQKKGTCSMFQLHKTLENVIHIGSKQTSNCFMTGMGRGKRNCRDSRKRCRVMGMFAILTKVNVSHIQYRAQKCYQTAHLRYA